MRPLLHNLYFWLVASITLILLLVMGLFFFPPVVGQFNEHRQQLKELAAKVAENERFLATVSSLERDQATLDKLHEQATLSLPEKPQPEILILQLDGLLKSLGLTKMTIDVPLTATVKKGAETEEVKTTYTLSGPATFDQAKQLVAKLRTLSRWNKLKVVSITKQGDESKVTISGEAFSKQLKDKNFSGNSNLLAEATAFFDAFQAYTTVPDVANEGNFGKTDPFN